MLAPIRSYPKRGIVTFVPIAHCKGETFTAIAQLDARLDSSGVPVPDRNNVFVFLLISPAINPAEVFEDVLPDIPDFRLLIGTPNACIYTQDVVDFWTPQETIDYLQENVPKLVKYLDSVESLTFFNQE